MSRSTFDLKINNQPHYYILEYKYDSAQGPLQSAYTADYGGTSGKLVGAKIKDFAHRTLGGDGDYNDVLTPQAIAKKFPNQGGGYTFLEIGNHERKIEGRKIGDLKGVEALARNFPISNSGSKYFSHPLEGNLPLPTAEIFLDTREKTVPFCIVHVDSNILPALKDYRDYLIELLNYLKNQYSACNVVLSLHHAPETYGVRRRKTKDANKYLDHANRYLNSSGLPMTRKTDLKEISRAQESKEKKQKEKFKKAADAASKAQEDKTYQKLKHKVSPLSWNKEVSRVLQEVYEALEEKKPVVEIKPKPSSWGDNLVVNGLSSIASLVRASISTVVGKSREAAKTEQKEEKEEKNAFTIISTQSGHDHYAAIMRKKKQPWAILQGNGSQRGVASIFNPNPGKQHVQGQYAQEGIRKGKLYGVDYLQSQEEARYLRLGFGKWDISNTPTYTQYYFDNPKDKNSALLISTQMQFCPDRRIVVDYIQKKVDTYSLDGKLLEPSKAFTSHSLVQIIAKDPNCRVPAPNFNLYASGENLFDYQFFYKKLEEYFYQREVKLFHDVIIHAYESHAINFKTLIALNKGFLDFLYPSKNVEPKSLENSQGSVRPAPSYIAAKELDEIIRGYREEKDKGLWRKLKGDTQTIKDLAFLSQEGGMKVYAEEIHLILKLRDRRHNRGLIKSGQFSGSSLTLFAKPNQDSKNPDQKLTHTEQAISKLASKMQ